ncbi:SDR family NAD(P)-dependent oxidoreductase [Streptomyces sp. NPDC088847]|uniref:SDR family NAD(P)-dependent oxidoreductase n=1 Tax=Streptomyces sp. NPDC088847 TaxID=3365909 RepID=UPI003821547C
MTDLKNAVVLVTGANGGLGREFVVQAVARRAAKVYVTARTPQVWDDDRVVPFTLDITNHASVTRAATDAGDVPVLINNSGAFTGATLLSEDPEAAKALLDINFWGQLRVSNTFAPVLAANGGGGFLNVLPVLSWLGISDAYSATKTAFWSATNTQRLALAKQGTGLYLGAHRHFDDRRTRHGEERSRWHLRGRVRRPGGR